MGSWTQSQLHLAPVDGASLRTLQGTYQGQVVHQSGNWKLAFRAGFICSDFRGFPEVPCRWEGLTMGTSVVSLEVTYTETHTYKAPHRSHFPCSSPALQNPL